MKQTPRDISFCTHALLQRDMDLFVVPDAREDEQLPGQPAGHRRAAPALLRRAPLRTPDGLALGTLCVLDYVPRQLSEVQENAIRVLARQVTARLELRRALAEQVQLLDEQGRAAARLARDAALLANVRDSVIVTDLAGVVTFWNEGATRLFGWRAEEMLGRPLVERFPEHARAEVAGMIRKIAAGEEFAGEWPDYRRDGSRVWIEVLTRRIDDPAGVRWASWAWPATSPSAAAPRRRCARPTPASKSGCAGGRPSWWR